MHNRRSIIPYVNASRKVRKDTFIRYKNRIAKSKDSDLFYTNLVLDYNPDSQWFDFYFLSKKYKHVVWNATIVTHSLAFWDKVSDIAYDHTDDLLKFRDPDDNFLSSLIKKEGTNFYEFIPKNITYPELDNKTFTDYWKDYEQIVIDTNPPIIHEYIKIDYKYSHGIGLHFMVDITSINKNIIETAIVNFYNNGEQAWINPIPVPTDHLPKLSERNLGRSLTDKSNLVDFLVDPE